MQPTDTTKVKQKHEFPNPRWDEACIKCGGFEGEPCEPPTGDGKKLYEKYCLTKEQELELEQMIRESVPYDEYGFSNKGRVITIADALLLLGENKVEHLEISLTTMQSLNIFHKITGLHCDLMLTKPFSSPENAQARSFIYSLLPTP